MLVADVEIYFFDAARFEGRFATEKLVSDDTQAPNVDFFGVDLSLNELRSHVKWRSQHQSHTLFLLKFLSESQITYLDIKVVDVFGNKQNILWFHIPMCDRLKMQIVET